MNDDQPKTEIGRATVAMLVSTAASREGRVNAQSNAAKIDVADEMSRVFDAAKAQFMKRYERS